MSDRIRIYHNPRCSKSRATLALLEENDVQADVIEYLDTPPTAGQLNDILDMLGLEPRELMRTHEAEYKDAGLDDSALTCEQLIDAMIKHPKLIERPIVVKGGKAAIGRPPERVLDIL
ncbi:MAG TPA: arsenate reductase (glutaredoxin) [Gammaproteobacteria bacterium]|jgi:arsenate reductase|nr:arsenate reductase (glutaredoxin) [Gammaproteobacteria bacterium]